MFEAVILMIVFAVLVTYSIGFFGSVHTGIKNSIAARNLAFETFRNRANLSYRRDVDTPQGAVGRRDHYKNKGYRNHQVVQEFTPSTGGAGVASLSQMWATDRKIAFVRAQDDQRSSISRDLPPALREETEQADPIYIKTLYGICLNEGCGD